MIKPMDYSKLNPIELKAISIAYQNMEREQEIPFDPSYPYFCAALEELGATLETFPLVSLGGLKILHDELLTINKHLLEMSPKLPSLNPEEIAGNLTNDEVIDGLLKIGIITSLVNTFSYIQKLISMRIAMLEKGVLMEAANEQIN
ncbi:hypothetical protein [Necropsobacter rosorum]|uniref:hypothetical protein n=1 Tax=Necropsobacter rosorum TaxID=908285 RepID=UPI0005093E54